MVDFFIFRFFRSLCSLILRFWKDDYADIDPKDLAREIEESSAPPKIYNKKYQASILFTNLPTSTPSNLTSALHAYFRPQ